MPLSTEVKSILYIKLPIPSIRFCFIMMSSYPVLLSKLLAVTFGMAYTFNVDSTYATKWASVVLSMLYVILFEITKVKVSPMYDSVRWESAR